MEKNYLSTDQTEKESEQLFPSIQSPTRGTIVPKNKREFLGINPYSTLQERERHRQHLKDLEDELQRKEDANNEALAAKEAMVRAQLEPVVENSAAAVGDGSATIDDESPIIAHARKRNPLLPSGGGGGGVNRKAVPSSSHPAAIDAVTTNENDPNAGALMD